MVAKTLCVKHNEEDVNETKRQHQRNDTPSISISIRKHKEEAETLERNYTAESVTIKIDTEQVLRISSNCK